MSFSSKTKNELTRLDEVNSCCLLAELAGIIAFAGVVKSKEGKYTLKISTENSPTARRIFNLIKWNFGVNVGVQIRKTKSIKGVNNYSLYIEDNKIVYKILQEIKLIRTGKDYKDRISYRIHDKMLQSLCCQKSFIRGAFLGSGSIADPEKAYHLEIVTHHYLLSRDLCRLLEKFSLNAKVIMRKSHYVVYFKGSEHIVDFLNIIGAHKSLMSLENIRILKEMRNNVNRVVNCETANLGKTVNASVKQIKGIERIKNSIGLGDLPKSLREIAELRLEYKEASLRELGQMLNPPIGKSGVNHRLRKLENIAEGLGDN
jgi:DNA-binding protein WhiA